MPLRYDHPITLTLVVASRRFHLWELLRLHEAVVRAIQFRVVRSVLMGVMALVYRNGPVLYPPGRLRCDGLSNPLYHPV